MLKLHAIDWQSGAASPTSGGLRLEVPTVMSPAAARLLADAVNGVGLRGFERQKLRLEPLCDSDDVRLVITGLRGPDDIDALRAPLGRLAAVAMYEAEDEPKVHREYQARVFGVPRG